jgi:hypothetical protein
MVCSDNVRLTRGVEETGGAILILFPAMRNIVHYDPYDKDEHAGQY